MSAAFIADGAQPALNKAQAWVLAQLVSGRSTVALTGGWGSGKTHAIAILLHYATRTRPGEDGLIVYPRAGQAAAAFGALAEGILPALGWAYHASYQGAPAPHWLAPTGERVWVRAYYRPGTVAVAANTLEGLNVGWAILDEAQTFATSEPADMAWGRTRGGSRPFIAVFARPTLHQWWPRWAEARGGVHAAASSTVNRANIPGWDAWVSGMTQAERDERLHCRPVAPVGAVYGAWRLEEWPRGNLTPRGWAYDPAMRGHLAVDWGRRHPSALLIVEDAALGVDVIVAELNPDDVSVHQLAALIMELAAPRALGRAGVVQLDAGVGDKAGKAKNDQTLKSAFDVLAALPGEGGLGLRLTHAYGASAERAGIANGVAQVQRRVWHDHHGRRLLITPDAWAASVSAPGVSLARALNSYRYPPGATEPRKDGQEHPLDALRYFVAEYRWERTAAQPSGLGATMPPPARFGPPGPR